MDVKLGRRPHSPMRVAACLQAHEVLNLSTLPETPAAFDWSQKDGVNLAYPILGNDRYGDCCFASACHMIGTWTGQNGVQQAITEEDALDAYRRFTGFSPGVPESDHGAVMLDVADRWVRGEPIAGHVIRARVAVNPRRLDLMAAASNLFGGLWTGWALPTAWQDADVWDVSPEGSTAGKWAPWSWGGHATASPLWSPAMLGTKTWTQDKPATIEAVPVYCEEAYALLSELWIERIKQRCPAGIDLQRLIDAMTAVQA